MFVQKRKNAQILLKIQLSARECWKCKIVLQIRRSAEKVLRLPYLALPRIRDVWSRNF